MCACLSEDEKSEGGNIVLLADWRGEMAPWQKFATIFQKENGANLLFYKNLIFKTSSFLGNISGQKNHFKT